MATVTEKSSFDLMVEPVLQILTPDQMRKLMEFRADTRLVARVEELGGKCTEGELTEAERAEYQGYAEASRFIATLKSQARKLLSEAAAQ